MKFSTTTALSRCAGLALTLAFARVAHADPSASDRAAAEALFVGARKLLNEKKYVEACKALAESQHLDPGVGTLLNLGLCYEKLGRTASAWSTYREAAIAARAAHQTAREKNARIAAEALEKQVPMLTVTVLDAAPALEVRRDGAVVPRSLWGLAIAIDPGEHVFEASAAGRKTWRSRVMADAGRALSITVPALEPDGSLQPATVPKIAPVSSPAAKETATPKETAIPKEPAPSSESTIGAQRVAGLVLVAAGIGSVAVGGYFGLNAKSAYTNAACAGHYCTPDGLAQRDRAYTKATISTVLVGGGLAALAGGVTLLLTAPTTSDDGAAAKTGTSSPRFWIAADPFGEGGAKSLILTGVFE